MIFFQSTGKLFIEGASVMDRRYLPTVRRRNCRKLQTDTSMSIELFEVNICCRDESPLCLRIQFRLSRVNSLRGICFARTRNQLFDRIEKLQKVYCRLRIGCVLRKFSWVKIRTVLNAKSLLWSASQKAIEQLKYFSIISGNFSSRLERLQGWKRVVARSAW